MIMNKNKTIIIILLVITLAALWRYYYTALVYNFTFASWDSTWIVLNSYYFIQNFFQWGHIIIHQKIYDSIFWSPFLLSYLFALCHSFLKLDIQQAPFFVTSLFSLVLIVWLSKYLLKQYHHLIAILSIVFISVNTYFALYSTEPLRETFVIFFFIAALLAKQYNYRVALFFWCNAFLWHNTWLIYLLVIICIIWYDQYTARTLSFKKLWLQVICWLILILFIKVFPALIIEKREMLIHLTWIRITSSFLSEIDALLSNIKSWFTQIWLIPYWKWMQNRIGSIHLISFIGVIYIYLQKKVRGRFTDILITYTIVFLLFSIKWAASSHSTRYPYYLFIFSMIVFVILLEQFYRKHKVHKIHVLIIVLLFLSWWNTYYNKYVWQLRHIYQINKVWWTYIAKQLPINEHNRVLLLWWPDTMLSIVKDTSKFDWDNYITYWRQSPYYLSQITLEFIKDYNIKFFIYEDTGKDYFDSQNILFFKFQKYLKEIQVIYQYHRKVVVYEFVY